jgi:putative aminopeptidase FrvX
VQTLELLERIFNQPTAPFREGFVRNELARILTENKIPHFTDRVGNLIAGARSFAELKSSGFRIALMAHMDHPGFHLDTHVRGRTYQCRWYGGAPWKGMKGRFVRLHDPADLTRSVRGRIGKMIPPKDEFEDGLRFHVEFAREISDFSSASFGGFDFTPLAKKGDRLTTRAADDLAGCVIALGALLDEASNARPSGRRLVGIFTRAEEVGFIGCMDLLLARCLPKNLWLVSLEASKQLPEAIAGRGPVLRIGDKSCLFDSELSATLWSISYKLSDETAKKARPFKYQRRLMSGGTCEATPLALHGFQVAGLAVPLLNYHNVGTRGQAAPEIISLSDVEKARQLCFELGRRLKRRPSWSKKLRKEIVGYYKTFTPMLRTKISYDSGAHT